MSKRPVIVISATRFFQGGTLVIVEECLKFLSAHYSKTHTIKALVYKKTLYDTKSMEGIEWVEFPKSRKSIIYRLYHEYIKFYKLSKAWKPMLWLSLQDSTPRVMATISAVYFHNPLLLKPKSLKLWNQQPRLEILRLLYKYIYTQRIGTNDFVITQQSAIAAYLTKAYGLDRKKVWVFPPVDYLLKKNKVQEPGLPKSAPTAITQAIDLPVKSVEITPYTFIFPATAFYYKNHAVIIEACRILQKQNPGIAYRVLLTLDGSENKYVQKLVENVRKELPQIMFLGFIKRDLLFNLYNEADCMIFPSFLESWGLPLTEFAGLNKPIICADLPYGRATLAGYHQAIYFDPTNPHELAHLMLQAAEKTLRFHATEVAGQAEFPYLHTWKECFELLLA